LKICPDARAVLIQDLTGFIRGTVIDDDEFEIVKILADNAIQGLFQDPSPIIRRDDYADQRVSILFLHSRKVSANLFLMILFDGTYRLGKYTKKTTRRSKDMGPSWRIRIIDLSTDTPDLRHLRPVIVHVARNPGSVFPSDCANSLGARILRDFDLETKKVLWIEECGDVPHVVRVAIFRPKQFFGDQTFYSIDWRPIQTNERQALQRFIPEAGLPSL
jgi:hypothetical protein